MTTLNDVAEDIGEVAEVIAQNAAFVAAFLVKDLDGLRRRVDTINDNAKLLTELAYSVKS